MKRRMQAAAAAAFMALASQAAIAGGEAAPMVMSTSLCADQFALALLPPERIVSLSRSATDPDLSIHWRQAATMPGNRGTVEEIVMARPDIVMADAWGVDRTRAFLEAEGMEVIALPLLEDLNEIADLTETVAARLGVPERGHRLANAMRARIAVAESPEATRPRTLYMSPGGTTAGPGSFGHEVLRAGGAENIAATEMGLEGWSSIALEQAVLADPDLLVLSFFRKDAMSLTQRMRFHAGFQTLLDLVPATEIKGRHWICAGWFLMLAIADLRIGMAELRRDGRLR